VRGIERQHGRLSARTARLNAPARRRIESEAPSWVGVLFGCGDAARQKSDAKHGGQREIAHPVVLQTLPSGLEFRLPWRVVQGSTVPTHARLRAGTAYCDENEVRNP